MVARLGSSGEACQILVVDVVINRYTRRVGLQRGTGFNQEFWPEALHDFILFAGFDLPALLMATACRMSALKADSSTVAAS